MEKQTINAVNFFLSPQQRLQLVRFCTRVTRRSDIAEDLAQETLLEAWRSVHTLHDAGRREAWLFGIARNVCLRWLRTHGRDLAHLHQPQPGQDFALSSLEDVLVDDTDIEIALERKELSELLDRALLLLPAETRAVLIQRYIEESSLAQIAAQLGTNVGAVAMRLQRGKLVLRRVLTQQMGQEMNPYMNVPDAPTAAWEVTPLWCHSCGQRYLLGQRDPGLGKLLLKCPVCDPGNEELSNRNHLPMLKGIRGYKPLYSRLATWCDHYYRTGLRDGSIACVRCGRTIPAAIQTPEQFPRWMHDQEEMRIWMNRPDERVVTILCKYCFASGITTLEGLVLESTPGQQFLKAHPRIRTLPRQYLETDGRSTILSQFESVTDSARLDIISDEETYEILHSFGGAQ